MHSSVAYCERLVQYKVPLTDTLGWETCNNNYYYLRRVVKHLVAGGSKLLQSEDAEQKVLIIEEGICQHCTFAVSYCRR